MTQTDLQLATLPAWLAYPYGAASGHYDPSARFKCTLESWEALLEYGCMLLISAYLEQRAQAPNDKLDQALAQHFAKKASMGDWNQLFQALVRNGQPWAAEWLGTTADQTSFTSGPVLEMFNELQENQRQKVGLFEFLNALCRMRNDFAHRASNTAWQRDCQPRLLHAFEEVACSLPGLTKWQLSYVKSFVQKRSGFELTYCVVAGNAQMASFQTIAHAPVPGEQWLTDTLVFWDGAGSKVDVREWLASYEPDQHVLSFLQGTEGRGQRLLFHTRMGREPQKPSDDLHSQFRADLPLLSEPPSPAAAPAQQGRAAERYRTLFREFLLDDGLVSEREASHLADVAELGGLAEVTIGAIQAQVRAEIAQMQPPVAGGAQWEPAADPAGALDAALAEAEAAPAAVHSLSWLREARQRLGVSLEWTAGRAGTSSASLSRWEHGVSLPDADQFARLEATLMASWLRPARTLLAWSQDQLAAQIGVSCGAVSTWENARAVPWETQAKLLIDKIAPAFAIAAYRRLGEAAVPGELRVSMLGQLCDRLYALAATALDGPQLTTKGTVGILTAMSERAQARLDSRLDGELVRSDASPWLLFRKPAWQVDGCEYGITFSTESKVGARPLDRHSYLVGIGMRPLDAEFQAAEQTTSQEQHAKATKTLVAWLAANWPQPGIHAGVPLPAEPMRALSQDNRWWPLVTSARYEAGTDPALWADEVIDRLDALAQQFIPALDGFAQARA